MRFRSTIRRAVQKAKAAYRSAFQMAHQRFNRRTAERFRNEIDDEERLVRTLVNRLTNWQRHQWARAGRPEASSAIQKYTILPHWKHGRLA